MLFHAGLHWATRSYVRWRGFFGYHDNAIEPFTPISFLVLSVVENAGLNLTNAHESVAVNVSEFGVHLRRKVPFQTVCIRPHELRGFPAGEVVSRDAYDGYRLAAGARPGEC